MTLNVADITSIKQISYKEYNVNTVNSIADKYPDLRQRSKEPTFLLAYQGTEKALIENCGFSPAEAKNIDSSYHDLYKETDKWLNQELDKAAEVGYVTCAFGHKVRTPLLQRSIRGAASTLHAAQKESRTAGNALGQSYGLLNNRAANEFYERLKASPHQLSVLPVCHIHDAQYFLVRKSPEVLHWVNQNLVECMSWQDLPAIQHDEVKLGADLEMFFPSWAKAVKLKNNLSLEEITKILEDLPND